MIHIESLLFHPNLQTHILSELNGLSNVRGRRSRPRFGEDIREWALGQVIKMSHVFKNLNTDSKCHVADAIIHRGDRGSLEELFRISRHSNYLKVLQRTAEVLYILDSEFERDNRDPDFFHEKLMEIKPKSSKYILFFQLLSRLQRTNVGDEDNYPIAIQLYALIDRGSIPVRGPNTQSFESISLEVIAAKYGGLDGGFQEAGVRAVIELGRRLPDAYFELNLEPEQTVMSRRTVIDRLPRDSSSLRFYEKVVLGDPDRWVRLHAVRRMLHFPLELTGKVTEILCKMDEEEGSRIYNVIQKHLDC